MTASTEILPFADDALANVMTQVDYEAATTLRGLGFQSGEAQSEQLNKVWRQSSFMAAILANWMVSQNVSQDDDGDVDAGVDNLQAALAAFASSIARPHGQCHLAKSGSSLLLSPYNGNKLIINSAVETIPDAGVSLSTSGLSNSTTYYIYAYMNAGTMTLVGSTTGYTTQADTGIKVKSDDATRTLVGMARVNGSASWVDSATQRFVLSYFNRNAIALLNSFSADRTTTSSSYAEINSEIRTEFLTWGNEAVSISANGASSDSSSSATVATSIGIDGTTAEDTLSQYQNSSASDSRYWPVACALQKGGLSEGYHYATVLGKTSAGTATWAGSGTAGTRTALTARIQG